MLRPLHWKIILIKF